MIKFCFDKSHIQVFSLKKYIPYNLHFTHPEHNARRFTNVIRESGPYLAVKPWGPQSTSEKPVTTFLAQSPFQFLLTTDAKYQTCIIAS